MTGRVKLGNNDRENNGYRAWLSIPFNMEKWIHRIMVFIFLLFALFLNLALSPHLFAGEISFNDSRWQWTDTDYSGTTSKSITTDSRMSISAGGKVWTDADIYASYFLEDINGDFTVTVKIISQENTDNWAKAGLIVRNDMTANALSGNGYGYCIIAATPGNGIVFQYDTNGDGKCDDFSTTRYSQTLPYWLKLTKENKKYTGSFSYDGTNWFQLAFKNYSSVESIQDVGIFVSSGTLNSESTVVFEHFSTDNEPIARTYTITSTAGENGEISPSGETPVSEGDSKTYTITPSTGYEVNEVTVGDDTVTLTDSSYTFSNVTSDYTISVSFSQLSYAITATKGDNGSITPIGSTNVLYGNSQTYAVTPDDGYEVDTVTVDGSTSELTNDQYIFSNVTSTHSIHVTFRESEQESDPETDNTIIAGCATNSSADYSSGFDAGDFDLINMGVSDRALVLSTGADSIDPDNIVIPFEQEISVTFLYEAAGYISDFGWMLKSDAVDGNGNFKEWNNIPSEAKHPVFRNIIDDSEGDGGNGILDSGSGSGNMPTSDEAALAVYNDGTEYRFAVDGDGSVSAKDMKKNLGTFAGGTEIVFFLTADKDWNTSDTNGVFFTKKDWNPDTYGACGTGTYNKIYNLGTANTSEGVCTEEGGWLSQGAIYRMNSVFGISLSGTYNLPITVGQKYSHVIVGAPDTDPDQWILGWEDLDGGGDADHNDMVFKIDRKTGGIAQLKSSQAIEPDDVNAYYTAVTFEVWDSMPCSGNTEITYYVSIDNGVNWVEITDWDIINQSDASKTKGSEISSWTPGTPQYTYRSRRIDFAGRDLYGRAIVWKAEMSSDDPACAPGILDVAIDGNVSTNGSFSRGEPVVVANVIYSGSYETPSVSWTEKVQRGHLTATRLYLPGTPSLTSESQIWDAGTRLSVTSPGNRTIYYPGTVTTSVTEETLATGDGSQVTFTGTLAHYPVSATTLTITDQRESFEDKHTDVLEGSLGGTGTINRFTGVYSLTFNSPPGNGVPIKAGYSYYTSVKTLRAFNTTNISSSMLGLDNTYVIGSGFVYDFNGDGKYNNVDRDGAGTANDSDGDWLVNWIRGYSDGSSTAKAWPLGPIDHSVPALATPPGKPSWYYGSDVSDTEKSSYDTFRTTYSTRQTVAYAGARDGMLHAFDAGKFRWGDNPDTTTIYENRGYFLWENGSPNYGTGSELWAFIPANLIPRLKNNKLSGDDRAYVDASPALADVYVDINDGNGTLWRTILLSAEGNGGDTVFCLDVTNPYSPFFLWEFADPDLFRSRSSPAVAQIGRILVNGASKWVAFFVSGKSYDSSLYPSIYMINVADGSVIERVFLNSESGGIGGVPSGQPAIVDSDGNGYIDRLYVGTDKGYMYKVNIPDDPNSVAYSINHCVINTDFTDDDDNTINEAQRYHPIYASPTVIVERSHSLGGDITSNVKIFFGTGDNPYFDEDINTSETTYHFFSYIDESEKGSSDSDDVSLDWFYQLDSGHRVFASAFAAAGTIYFGTSTADTEDPCSDLNEGQLIALDMDDGSEIVKKNTGNIFSAPIVDDKHVYIKTPSGLLSFGGGTYNNAVNVEGTTSINTKMWREVFESD